ncbi:helix-turn-helix transcriptional regulator [Amylibacter sp. SFDW26]|uniref:winged helix-turn-helix transcriptional regulator n=1 Tax=Amylibacter sp. SFDW26 TaxID=2652722 RepID=UPI0012626217|nr:helix-turn-helix domain-containing protein [Amylibacter sp. SFDW26]KAB7615312.1 helix-turn-helix transcriptional regulator [Amylibacter sp. SFDW26]
MAIELSPVDDIEETNDCAVELAVMIITGKWKPILMFHMLSGAKRFSELQKLVPQASDRMITKALREMEQDKLVTREVFAEVPARVEYSITQDGRNLMPVLNAMSDWANSRQS